MDFNELLEKFGKLPRVQRVAVIALVQVLILALFWTLLYSPTSESLVQFDQSHNELVTKKEQVRLRAENREQFEAELQQLTSDLRQALRELPNDREIPEFLKRISQVGKKVGLEIRRFQPLAEARREYYAEVPVALEVRGSYHEVAMFFDRLSKLNRIVYVKDIDIVDPIERGGKVVLSVSGNAVTFRFLTDEEIEKGRGSGKSKSKRGGRH
jgi:type IV pilus assembly protein PilO